MTTIKRLLPLLALTLILMPQTALAWNFTGHQLVAGIAWDNMTPEARAAAIAILEAAPGDACLLNLMPDDSRPLAVRQREFFMRAATWPDVVRPDKKINDTRPCIRFHQPEWHFFDRFWEGESGGTGASAPKDRKDIKLDPINAVERLTLFRPLVACGTAACGTPPSERAMKLAWILHMVGDIHQPLHTSGRLSTQPDEKLTGDQGGNLFKLNPDDKAKVLHSFWDGIIDASIVRGSDEREFAYFDRVMGVITTDHPRSQMAGRIRSGEFDAWALEGLATAKHVAYPHSLKRLQTPSEDYRKTVFKVADEAIALGGYRLADLLNRMLAQ